MKIFNHPYLTHRSDDDNGITAGDDIQSGLLSTYQASIRIVENNCRFKGSSVGSKLVSDGTKLCSRSTILLITTKELEHE